MNSTLVGIMVITAVAGTSIIFCPVPWSAALLALSAFAAIAAWKAKRETSTIVLANLAAVLMALAAFEGYLGIQDTRGDGTRMEGTITGGFTHPDDVLGYAPDPRRQVTARKLFQDQALYDVVYTIGPDGLRIMPSVTGFTTAECIVFFGDSVTFGEGVDDDESYPFLTGLLVAGRYAVHNFAYSGYGPHQMLATLQAGNVEKTVSCRPSHFFYLGILEHIPRVAGLAQWDQHGPRFRLDADGTLLRDGNFDTVRGLWRKLLFVSRLDVALTQYLTWQKFFGNAREPDSADLDLYVHVILASARIARERFPGSEFQMILWDGRDDPRLSVIEQRVKAGGIRVHRLTTAIPDFATQASRYLLSPHDGHPNPEMHRRLAEYIAGILPEPTQR